MSTCRPFFESLCDFQRTETAGIKGMAILLMLAHHLYGMYNVRIPDELRYPDWVKLMADYFRLCVPMFLFVTGYGLRCSAEKDTSPLAKAVLKRLSGFYPMFLVLLAFTTAFSCIGTGFGRLPQETTGGIAASYLFSATGLMDLFSDYWYVGIFLMTCLVIYPLLLAGLRMGRIMEVLVFLLLCAAACFQDITGRAYHWLFYIILYGRVPQTWYDLISQGSWYAALPWISTVLFGWAVASTKFRSARISASMVLLSYGVLYFNFMDTYRTCLVPGLLLLPLLGASKLISRTGKLSVILQKFGTLSAVMWLTHRWIFGYWFATFFYSIPAPWNYLLLVFLSAALAWLFLMVWKRIPSLFHTKADEAGKRPLGK